MTTKTKKAKIEHPRSGMFLPSRTSSAKAAKPSSLKGNRQRRCHDSRQLGKTHYTSPPYNIGKAYEKAHKLEAYLENLTSGHGSANPRLADDGSLCWQVGNYVEASEIFPLDIFYYPYFKSRGLRLRNRIVWHFDHGLHASKRFSGRYEVLL